MAIVTQAAVSGSRSAGVKVAGGVVAGLMVWGVLTVIGLSALLAASAEAYFVVKLLGAAYLLYLGASSLWRSRSLSSYRVGIDGARSNATWQTGLATNLLNPKIAVFYTGVLTQLVPPGWSVAPSLALLVAIHAALSMAWLSTFGLLLSRLKDQFEKPRVRQSLERVTGTVLVGFGATVALQARQ